MVILLHHSPKHWDDRCELLAFSLKSTVLTPRLTGQTIRGGVCLSEDSGALLTFISGAVRAGLRGHRCAVTPTA